MAQRISHHRPNSSRLHVRSVLPDSPSAANAAGQYQPQPKSKFQYFTEAPILNSLLALETGHQLPAGQIEADRKVAAEVCGSEHHDHWVRSGEGASVPPDVVPEATIPCIETVLPVEKITAETGITAYAVRLPPLPSSMHISADVPLARLHLADGWGPIQISRAPALLQTVRTISRCRHSLKVENACCGPNARQCACSSV